MLEAQESLWALHTIDRAEFRKQAAAHLSRHTRLFSSSTSPVLAALANTGGAGVDGGPAADLLRFLGCAEAIFEFALIQPLASLMPKRK